MVQNKNDYSRHTASTTSIHTLPNPMNGSWRSRILPHTANAGDAYRDGDVYHRVDQSYETPNRIQSQFNQGPYYQGVQQLSARWPHLRYLLEFMDVTCAPPKRYLLTDQDRAERRSRIKLSLLNIASQVGVESRSFEGIDQLQSSLASLPKLNGQEQRLVVVEDLSSDVIETLGNHFDIDPRFFRGHISDYLWYNIRDPWVELPDMQVLASTRTFFHVRYVQPRYFRTQASANRSREQAGTFNVLRRVDMEQDRSLILDEPDCVVGLVRSKASFWFKPQSERSSEGVEGETCHEI